MEESKEMVDRKVDNIGIFGTVYSLYLYFLIQNKEQFDSTLYFVCCGVPKEIRNNLSHFVFIDDKLLLKKSKLGRFLWKATFFLFKRRKWKYIDRLPIWGHDHLVFSSSIIGRNSITVIEDGLANYYCRNYYSSSKYSRLTKKILSYFLGPFYNKSTYGSHPDSSVILTGIKPIPIELKNKCHIISPEDLWKESSQDKKDKILSIFNITVDDISLLSTKKVILIAQPFYTVISDSDFIKLYQNALCSYSFDEVVIKPHPRDTFDYHSAFPNITIFNHSAPLEIFASLGVVFEEAITISSTAIFSLSPQTKKIILGYKCHPELNEKFGDICI